MRWNGGSALKIGLLISLISSAILVLVFIKIKAILSAVVWIYRSGRSHVRNIKKVDHKLTEDVFFSSFENSRGGFFPFGVKDYKLRRFIEQVGASRSGNEKSNLFFTMLEKVLKSFHLSFFTYHGLSVIVSVFIISASVVYFNFPSDVFGEGWGRTSLYLLSLEMFLMNMAMIVEAIFGHLFLSGDYASYFHMLLLKNKVEKEESSINLGLKCIFAVTLFVVVTGVAGVFSSYLLCEDSFVDLFLPDSPTSSELNVWKILGHCTYFVITILTTTPYNRFYPTGGAGMVIVALLQIQCMAIVVVVLSVFLSVRPRAESAESNE